MNKENENEKIEEDNKNEENKNKNEKIEEGDKNEENKNENENDENKEKEKKKIKENLVNDTISDFSYSPPASPNKRNQFFNKGSQNIILHKHYKPEYILSLLQKKNYQRTKAEIRILADYLSEKYEFFRKLKASSEIAKLEKICSVLHLEEFKPNSTIIKFGEEGDKFYILLEGRVVLYKPSYPQKRMNLQEYFTYLDEVRDEEKNDYKIRRILEKNAYLRLDMGMLMSIPISNLTTRLILNVFVEEDEKLGEFGDGFTFGEIALIKKTTRNATIKAKKLCKLATINKADYNKIIKELEEKRLHKILKQFKENYPLFEYWTLNHLIRLMNCFSNKYLFPGDYLFKQNEKSDSIYIIKSGKFEIYSYVSLGWINEFYDYIIDSKSNLIYYLVGKSPVKEKEVNDILSFAEKKCPISPMKWDPYKGNKITISFPPPGSFEDLQQEKLDSVNPYNLFKVKIRNTEGPEVLGFCEALEMKNRFCFVKCVETAFVEKVKLIDFFKLVNLNIEEENKNWMMDIIAKKKRHFFIQLKKGVERKAEKEDEYFEKEFEDFLEKKGKFNENIKNEINSSSINDNQNNNKNSTNDIKKNLNRNLSFDIGKKKIENEVLNISKIKQLMKKKTRKNKGKNGLPLLRNRENLSVNRRKSKILIEQYNSDHNNNLTEYSSNKKTSYTTSQFASPKIDNNENELSQDKNSNLISLRINSKNSDIQQGKSQFLSFKNNKIINLKSSNHNNIFSAHKTSRNFYNNTFLSNDEEKKTFDLTKYRRNIDTNSEYLKTQILKLTGMKRIVPKKEITFNVYDENDTNLIQIQSDPRIKVHYKKRNKSNLFLTHTDKKKNIKNYPKILTEIYLKDFRNLRRRKNHSKL